LSKTILLLLLALAVINPKVNSQNKKTEKPFKKQFSLSIGMGISMSTAPSFVDYVRNDLPIVNKDSVKSFGVGFEFFGAAEYDVSKEFSLKLDYSYFVKNLSVTYAYFTYNYFYFIHQPYVMGFYVLRKNNYGFKFGGGLGYHFAHMTKDIGAGSYLDYNASGVAYRGEIEFYSFLSERLGSYVSGFIMGSSIGTLKDSNNNALKNSGTGGDVNLGGFGIGARLGISYYF
jgi:hypothetical protein